MEAYPMPLFVKLDVANMKKSLNWYKEVLHFHSIFELPDNDGNIVMAHIRGEKYQDIMLVSGQYNEEAIGKGVVLNFTVRDVNLFSENARKENAKIIEGPINRPWNASELVLKDPDGYQLTLSMNIDKDKDFDDIVEQIKA